MAATDDLTATERAELDALRARVAQLEAERDEEVRRAHAALAEAQERLYWLDRTHLDLEKIFGSAAGRAAFSGIGAARRRAWPAIRFYRRARGWVRSKLT